MFQELSRYLSKYKQVSIPEVGSISLVYQSASFDVASKKILPPSYLPYYSHEDSVKEHQIHILASGLNMDNASVQQQLQNFGRELRKKIQSEAFFWTGIGKLENTNSHILFYPDISPDSGLQSIPAEKIIREDVIHTVLVGEQEVQKRSVQEEVESVSGKRPYGVIIGWILVAAAIAFIIFSLAKDDFQTPASGNKTKVVPSRSQPLSK